MANGWGSRQRGRPGYKIAQQTAKLEDITRDLSPVVTNVPELVDAEPLSVISVKEPNSSSKTPISRLDDLILEAIAKLKEPRGSNRAAISLYIEERYLTPPNFERLLAANLKLLTEKGRLIKVKHQYRIAPTSATIDLGIDPPPLLLEVVQKDSSNGEKKGTKVLTKAQIDAELERLRSMTAAEAAAAAAQAVAEAEAAIAEAEVAAREAEEAEAEAEAAQCFAEAALKALKCRTVLVW
ncbi:single myb histone 1-like isoform X3 [Coffea arabica]